jgi:hypothetical protein
MRSRKTIEEEYNTKSDRDRVLIETLLDVRQLLAILVVNIEHGATAASIRDVANDKT